MGKRIYRKHGGSFVPEGNIAREEVVSSQSQM